MSTALAIAGVSAVLRDLLNDGLVNHNVSGVVGSTVSVSVLPPDRVVPPTGAEVTRLNIFLHQVTVNSAWRNHALPSRDAAGQRLTNPPLALDLHYLISAYGAEELHAEILLGYAMQLLHETPVLTREAIRTALTPSPNVGTVLPPALRALAECGLADQVEQIRFTPSTLGSEEMSRLWSALQAHYRPTAAYQASVVLIESSYPARQPLPVLSRGPIDVNTGRERGVAVQPTLLPPFPFIETVSADGDLAQATLDQPVVLSGHHLSGSGLEVVVSNERYDVETVFSPDPGATDTRVAFTIPGARSADLPAGVYRVSVRLTPEGEANPRESNQRAFQLAPKILGLPAAVARDGTGTAVLTLTVAPHVRQRQSVSLVVGQREVRPDEFVPPTDTLQFTIPGATPGNHLARLRVDGIDSPIVDRTVSPPVFLNQRIAIT
jgi:hypothetical protein